MLRTIGALFLLLGGPNAVNANARYLAHNATGARFLADNGEEMVNLVVTFNDNGDELYEYFGRSIGSEFKRTPAVTMTVPVSEIDLLINLPSVDEVEEDGLVYPLAETTPWGISAVQGAVSGIPTRDSSKQCLPVCIIDSGCLLSHEDMSFSRGNPNVRGALFGVSSDQPWYAPVNGHGTHVCGTILAQGGNNIGVRGVIPSSNGICLMIARVFPDGDGAAQNSWIDRAFEWCVDNGAKVINMSLGTPVKSSNSQNIMKQAMLDSDILVVAAAGNDGGSDYFYPASFDKVISVAAVDSSLKRASFSQYNDKVLVSAPGVDIKSLGTLAGVSVKNQNGASLAGFLMDEAPVPSNGLLAAPLDCGMGTSTCRGASGKVCIIARGQNSFEEKAYNCQLGGGVAAVIYNNAAGGFKGTVDKDNSLSIPVLGIPQEYSSMALGAYLLSIQVSSSSYATLSGTSMATPHVAGLAAKLWGARDQCTGSQIKEAITATAKDLGANGRDDYYGYGLVQAWDAYQYLLKLPPPCGATQTSGWTGTAAGTTSGEKITEEDPDRVRGDDRQLRGKLEDSLESEPVVR